MVHNYQLFRTLPDMEIMNKLLETFGLESITDTKYFTKESLKENDTVAKVTNLLDNLSVFYLPCKGNVYLKDITESRCIVILRQFLRVQGYTLISNERTINRKKMSVYRLIVDDKESIPKKKKKKDIVISFE